MPKPETKCWRNDAYARDADRAQFTDDFRVANALHSAPAYSGFVQARIGSIDTSAAEKLSGTPLPASVAPTMAGIDSLTTRR
jgi:CO/xanthine dehydrogenase Mo-binding subunit